MSDASNYDGGSIPWVTSQDVKSQYLEKTTIAITEKGARELTIYPRGSLVMVTRSGILRHTLPIAELRKPMTVNQDIRVIIPDEPLRCSWLLQSLAAQSKTLMKVYGKTGTTVESIDFSKMKSMMISVPDQSEQRKIGAFFSQLDSLITLHQREGTCAGKTACIICRNYAAETDSSF